MVKSYIDYTRHDVHIYYIDMPCSVTSNIVENNDGSYTIYINSRLSYERQLEGYLHELRHLDNNHFEEWLDIQNVEMEVREI